ncbi:MAG: leucyl/phenylalanyl-tRNA--protein transferase [Geminicoccaceae bacterium]
MKVLTPELVLSAYSIGLFPMANDREDPTVHWIDPIRRGIIPLNRFHIPRRLARTIRQGHFELRVNSDFSQVIRLCAETTGDRPRTWLNDEMIAVYVELAARGHAHSVEAWQGDELVGGLYGLALGGAFFGESMFSRQRDASKTALVELVARLRAAGFVLLDTQFVTSHLRTFGAIEISRQAYRLRLQRAIGVRTRFPRAAYSFALGPTGVGASVSGRLPACAPASTGSSAHSTTQTS